MYSENNDFPDLSRHSPKLAVGRRRIGLTLDASINLFKMDM
jgi:hypothetical protein